MVLDESNWQEELKISLAVAVHDTAVGMKSFSPLMMTASKMSFP